MSINERAVIQSVAQAHLSDIMIGNGQNADMVAAARCVEKIGKDVAKETGGHMMYVAEVKVVTVDMPNELHRMKVHGQRMKGEELDDYLGSIDQFEQEMARAAKLPDLQLRVRAVNKDETADYEQTQYLCKLAKDKIDRGGTMTSS